MAREWEKLTESLLVNVEGIREVKAAWATQQPNEYVRTLLALYREGSLDWPTALPLPERVRIGVYSPLQLLAYECGANTKRASNLEHPFHFSLLGQLIHLITTGRPEEAQPPEEAQATWPLKKSQYDSERKSLQSLFQIRELREEREPLSLEVALPSSEPGMELDAIRVAKIFGRGVAVATADGLARRAKLRTGVTQLFRNHDTAPASALYGLAPAYAHILPERLHLILRRDSHLVVAARENPLFEFYDGGWHMVDLAAARQVLRFLLDQTFIETPAAPELDQRLISLAYHMATHWHGGIIAVVDPAREVGDETVTSILDSSGRAFLSVRQAAEQARGISNISLTNLSETGLGRFLLTSAIQDGAVLVSPEGDFIAANQIVSRPGPHHEGGARRRAAKALADFGVVLTVSQDGAIRIFCQKEGVSMVPSGGLRVH